MQTADEFMEWGWGVFESRCQERGVGVDVRARAAFEDVFRKSARLLAMNAGKKDVHAVALKTESLLQAQADVAAHRLVEVEVEILEPAAEEGAPVEVGVEVAH